jgi:phospholipase/carboxylesterase
MSLGRAALVCSVACVACAAPAPDAPLELVEIVRGDRSRALPLIVALHGRGGNAAEFSEYFADLPFDARVISLEGPLDRFVGHAWFSDDDYERTLAEERTAARRIVATVRAYRRAHRTRGLPLAVGFSQGGIMMYELALREPASFAAVFSIAGARFGTFPDPLPVPMPAVHAFHGTADDVVLFRWEEEAIAHLREHGARAELTRIEGGSHRILSEVRTPLLRAMEGEIRRGDSD